MRVALIYMPSDCTASGKLEFFCGFVSVHPGTEKTGRIQATWDCYRAVPVKEPAITGCLRDLKQQGWTGFKVKEVKL